MKKNKNIISTSEFVDLLLATGGDFSRLTGDNVNQILAKAADIKRSAEKQAAQRKVFAARRHEKVIDYIKSLVGSYAVFTPTQIQLAEQRTGKTPMPYQFFTMHLFLELCKPETESRIERVYGPIEYRTKRGETKSRNVSSDKAFYRFI